MKRYWQIKSKNFDKIVLYRYGRFYLVYFQDADVCNKLIDLVIPPRQKQHIVGFHENYLDDNIEKLVNAGLRVAMCEQTENTQQMEERVKQEKANLLKEEQKSVL